MDGCRAPGKAGNLTRLRTIRTTMPMHRIRSRGAIGGPARVAVMAVALAVVSMVAGCGRESAEEALRGDIAALQAAIESRDAGEMAGFLAEDFVGNDGLDRDGARRLAAVHFLRNASIGVTPGPLDVEVQGDHATVRTTVVLTGGSGALLPERGRVHPVVSGWRREGDDWRMTSLAWGEQ